MRKGLAAYDDEAHQVLLDALLTYYGPMLESLMEQASSSYHQYANIVLFDPRKAIAVARSATMANVRGSPFSRVGESNINWEIFRPKREMYLTPQRPLIVFLGGEARKHLEREKKWFASQKIKTGSRDRSARRKRR